MLSEVTSTATFVVSFFIIVLIGVLYEWLREVQKAYDTRIARNLAKGKSPSITGRESPGEEALLLGRNGLSKGPGG